eukprot:9273265-Ditylum_brightwellii.AAC.1
MPLYLCAGQSQYQQEKTKEIPGIGLQRNGPPSIPNTKVTVATKSDGQEKWPCGNLPTRPMLHCLPNLARYFSRKIGNAKYDPNPVAIISSP